MCFEYCHRTQASIADERATAPEQLGHYLIYKLQIKFYIAALVRLNK